MSEDVKNAQRLSLGLEGYELLNIRTTCSYCKRRDLRRINPGGVVNGKDSRLSMLQLLRHKQLLFRHLGRSKYRSVMIPN